MTRIPVLANQYIPLYKPNADVFPGPDSVCFTSGTYYDKWVPNDFSVIQGEDGRWHMIGITHPAPVDFISSEQFGHDTIHDGEWLLFHSVANTGTFETVMRPNSFNDEPKLLPPDARPGERRDIYAPHIILKSSVYYMFYGPGPIRLATSTNLYDWTLQGSLFEGDASDRDPHIMPYNDGYRITYVSEDRLLGRFSKDLIHWGEPDIVFNMPRNGVPESPFIVRYEEMFYLFWCIYDGSNGPYDNRTFVYASHTPEHFKHTDYVTELKAHAPEVISDNGLWYLCSAEWPHRGISAAPLIWK